MATARCYTKSGSIEKYEENQWEGVMLKSILLHDTDYGITVPDSNGNYSVEGSDSFEVTNVGVPSSIPDNSTYWLSTRYGGKVCYFNFTKKNITISLLINNIGYKDYKGDIVFNCDISSNTNDFTINSILRDNKINLTWQVVNADSGSGVVGNYTTRIETISSFLLDTGKKYADGGRYYINRNNLKVNPGNGTYDGMEWKICFYFI